MQALHSHFVAEWKPDQGVAWPRHKPRATLANSLCIAAKDCLFLSKILRDISFHVRLMCPDN